jgi:hypothetical protein
MIVIFLYKYIKDKINSLKLNKKLNKKYNNKNNNNNIKKNNKHILITIYKIYDSYISL